ncbi:MAG: N-acetylmuramoyl-L-alanine amidase [Oscillospiraceae bacterium]
MKKANLAKKSLGFLLASTLLLSTAIPAFSYTKDKSDIDIIANTGVSLSVPQALNITEPSYNVSTSYSSYTVMGTSNPASPLYINGTEITSRGQFGSFAVNINLAEGKNLIEVTQDGATKSVYITRGSASSYTVATKITKAFPTATQAVNSGSTLKLTCVAPAGSQVYATFMGQTIELKQNVAASKGIAANFSADMTVSQSENTVKNCGNITYTLVNDGKTTAYNSDGNLMIAGNGASIVVQNMQSATALYSGNNTNTNIISTLRYGTVERVIDQNADMYRLGIGGWVKKSMVKPLEGVWRFKNDVSSVETKADTKGEAYILKGNAYPSFIVDNNNATLKITFYATSGVPEISTANSNIFSSAAVSELNGNTTITFTKKSVNSLWGYGVEYNQGETVIYCKKTPVKSDDSEKPLSGITIAIDAGHGGKDPGALGIARSTGPTEKDLTLASAIATKNRLEGLGAKVIMSRTSTDENPTFNERMFLTMVNRADFFISIHYNASLSLSAKGTEVYYFEKESNRFAQNVQSALVANTGRNNRGHKSTPFRVVLNTYCPSILTEIAFLSNPVEYDSVCSRTNIYNVANSMADGILSTLA